jgi:GntR family transcriptional regulator / MocR family aminotransferase
MADITVDDASPLAIYEQICRFIRQAISNGDLPASTQLPTSRELASALDVGRNTVIAAYERLSAEGYVVMKKRRGTRVAADWKRAPTSPVRQLVPQAAYDEEPMVGNLDIPTARPVSISYRAKNLLEMKRADSIPHGADPFLYPRNSLSQLLAEEFCRSPGSDVGHGARRFQAAVAMLLRQMRGVSCEPEQIIPVSGLEAALNLVSRVMLDPGHCAYVEDPSFELVRNTLHAAGVHVVPMPSDGKGADIGRASGPPGRLIYVSPSITLPLGCQMSEERREAVLDAARNWSAVVFECDGPWELSYSGSRLRALYGRGGETPVLYYAGFCQTLGPHIKNGYLVVPPELVEPFAEVTQRIGTMPDFFVLGALATFIETSAYAVHMRKLRSIYSQRLNAIVDAIRNLVPGLTVLEPTGGLCLTLLLENGLDEQSVHRAAVARGVPVAPLSQYYNKDSGRTPPAGLVLGLGAVADRAVETIVARLRDVVGETDSIPKMRSGVR